MSCCNTKPQRGIQYATSFDVKLLGVGCDVEVVVDIESGEATAIVAMRSFLRSTPAFRISLEDLTAVANGVRLAHTRAKLLEQMVDGANDHQLNFSVGGSSLIIVHPKDKKARFVLTIGSFAREGDLDKLTDKEIAESVKAVEELKAKVQKKVLAGTK